LAATDAAARSKNYLEGFREANEVISVDTLGSRIRGEILRAPKFGGGSLGEDKEKRERG
jgi:hypothetical protein